ncbi:SAM-dependent methyltransferase [Nocardia sp. NPDC057030]|uniref:SAM-dependent methyltransferase n=1 Tax=unclassified Nocardia TaxID=2637762 RepID=UPI00362B60EE
MTTNLPACPVRGERAGLEGSPRAGTTGGIPTTAQGATSPPTVSVDHHAREKGCPPACSGGDLRTGATMRDVERVPAMNPYVPSSARITNYLLDGKDNYDVDREVAHRMLNIAPDTKTLAWFVRSFLVKAVCTAGEAGVRQYIDLGCGMPLDMDRLNAHDAAHEVDPQARVAYVDNDPIVIVHADALLATRPEVWALKADVRQPGDLIDRLKSFIDFGEPVAVLMVGVLDYVMDDEDPCGIVAALRDSMAPGSWIAITQYSTDTHPDFIDQYHDDTDQSPAQAVFRTKEQTEKLFDGFDLSEPGVVPVQEWLRDNLPATRVTIYGGMAVKT